MWLKHKDSIFKNAIVSIFAQGVFRSYSQIFFSENYWFAFPLVIVSFLDASAGLCGLIAVLTSNLTASLLKFDKVMIAKGFYGYNSLLVGLGLGYYYELTFAIIAIAFFSGFFTLLITIAFQGVLGKYYLPYLSIPFVLCIWIVLSASWMVTGTEDNQSGLYILNKLFNIGGHPLVELHKWWVRNITSDFLNSYFQSLGAIFFQFNVFAGIVVAIALLFYSRIAFLLSLLGYSVAYLAYSYLGMDITQLGYSYIGFNFILGAIAVGGYFYIPSRQSFFWAFAITPIIALAAVGLFGLLKPLNLPIFSLPFNLILLSFIYSLRFRVSQNHFKEVLVQEGTPERNLYSYQSFTKRFPNYGWLQIKLPFLGEWYVNQGHDGEYTHQGEWAHAWDFVIVNSDLSQYTDEGKNLKDYYCFGKNVIAPADGSIADAEEDIEDNAIGEVNIAKNWGNTIVIKHSDGLYSKLSHLQKGSITVKAGDNVHYGQVIGKVGNSGRSPYPHLHFQFQSTPYIDSKTLKYPIFAFLENGKNVKTFSYPLKEQKVRSVEANYLLKRVFNLMPGAKLNWSVKSPKATDTVTWEVLTNPYNKSYIYCPKTKSIAFFYNDGVFFYITHFEGDRKSLLYAFYLAAFRIPLVYIDGFIAKDSLPINHTFKGWRLFIHDIIAPFYHYLTANFEAKMLGKGSELDLNSIEYHSTVSGISFSKLIWVKRFKLEINKDNSLIFNDQNLEILAICKEY